MSTIDILLITTSAAGVILVLGSLLLLWRGAITLNQATANNQLDLELWNKVKVGTRNPALALFVLGFVALLGSAATAIVSTERLGRNVSYQIDGTVKTEHGETLDGAKLRLAFSPKEFRVGQRGRYSNDIQISRQIVEVTMIAPGFENHGLTVTRRATVYGGAGGKAILVLGDLSAGKKTNIDPPEIHARIPEGYPK